MNVVASLEQVEALMITKGEINSKDTIYFVQSVLRTVEKEGKSVALLLDQASWHCSNSVKNSAIYKYLLLNIARKFDLNFVESVFSYIRNHWRRRRSGLESENEVCKEIVQIFRNANTEKRFRNWKRGYLKVLLRNMLSWTE